MASQDGADFGMRIGKNYQAEIPDLIQDTTKDSNLTRQMASLMWTPNPQTLDAKVDFYIEYATTKFNYSQEQALGLLLWHHHNIDMAIADLGNFAQTPDDWTSEDKILFEQTLARFGKNFNKIHDLMPDKSVGSLVRYYYSWKKSKKPSCHVNKNFTPHHEDSKGSFDVELQLIQDDIDHKRKSDSWMSSRLRTRNRTPYNLHLDAKELKLIARGYSEHMMRQLEAELLGYKGKVAGNKDVIETMRGDLSNGIGQFKRHEPSQDISSKWSNAELLLAMQGLRYYGKDFQSVSEIVGTKSEHLTRNLYFNHRSSRCALDASDGSKDDKMKIDENQCKTNQSEISRLAITTATNKSFQQHKNFLQHTQAFFKETNRGTVEK